MNMSKILNNAAGLAGVLALAMSATLAFAEVKEVMKIKVKTDDGLSETVKIENLGVGETEVFTTESGREVLVTRSEEALKLELDGQIIDVKMPKVHSAHEAGHGGGHVRMMHKDGQSHGDGDANIWVTEDDEVIVSEAGTRHVIIHRSGEDAGDFDMDADCDVEIIVDGEAVEGMEDITELCDVDMSEADGENVFIIKKKVMIHTDETDN